MNKRRIVCDVPDTMPNPKHIKLDHNCTDLLDGIDFVDFDDVFTSSEGTSDDPLAECTNFAATNLVNGHNSNDTKTDPKDNLLDLSTWKRCVIDDWKRDNRNNDLIIFGHKDNVKCDITEETHVDDPKMECRLQQFWSQSRIEVGVVVSLMAVWDPKLQSYCVTNSDGLIIVRPDFLISGTTIVGGLFCMRKAVLQDRFKSIEVGIKMVSLFECHDLSN